MTGGSARRRAEVEPMPISVTVATLSLTAAEQGAVSALEAWLDGPERARAARFSMPHDRQLFVAAHALTRLLLTSVDGRAPAQWVFVADAMGKPRVDALVAGPAPAFSLAHSRVVQPGPRALCGWVGAAATPHGSCELGLDLEAQDPTLALEELTAVLSAREAAGVRALPGPRRPAALARLWCLKEAWAKATGQGLAADLSQIGFEGRGRSLRLLAGAAPGGAWHIEQRGFRGGCHAALAVLGPPARPVRVHWRRWSVADVLRRLQGPARRARGTLS